MKKTLRAIAAWMLARFARAIVRKYRPIVVMVTGSVGKTSTKDASAAALASKFFVRASEKSYNSEFGVPLTIIGAGNPWSDIVQWSRVFDEAFALLVFPNHYPKLLVLEVGADRPGDLARILDFVVPDAVIVTRLPDVPVHVEAYASPNAVRDEEFAPAFALPPGAPLIVCADDEHALERARKRPAYVVTYGADPKADVSFSRPRVVEEEGRPVGMEADVCIEKTKYRLFVKGALGRAQLYPPLAALALGKALDLPVEEVLAGLTSYVPPPGRARILAGVHASTIIDDSYNASPAAVEAVLVSLDLLSKKHRRIVILGDMLELGRYSAEEHARIGTLAAEHADVVISVGSRAMAIADAARAREGCEVHSFADAAEAARALPDMVREGDVRLIKGSQGIRMERIVAALLMDAADTAKLVRQEKEWLKR